jgi:hypothetical protein
MSTYILPNLTAEEYNGLLPHLSAWGQDFFASVLNQFRAKGRLSEKQGALLDKLTAEARAKRAGIEARKAAPESVQVFTKLVEMFDKAAEQLKSPRVLFQTDDAGEFMVRRAKAESRNPGHLYVVQNGQYVGKVAPNGRFWPDRECTPAVETALVAFNRDPQKAALAYGQATGNCCFCARELTDARSVEAGYGPICAGNFGLPWGA